MNNTKTFRRAIIRAVAVSGAVLLALSSAGSGLASAKPISEILEEAQTQVRKNFASKAPGLAVAVCLDGKLIWSEGFGFADLQAKTPVTSRTMFRIGSISKPLTAAGLMLLVEQGRIDLDVDIHNYVPDFPDKGETITTRQLAGHLGGIRHYRGTEIFLNQPFATVRESLKIFENDPLLFKPGKRFSYSSYGWNLISMVMETGAKTNFLAYMKEAVFKPLNLKNTMPDFADQDLPQRTHFYKSRQGGGFEPEAAVNNSYKWAAGGFLSTPEDLARFGSALLRPGFLKRESLQTMFVSQKTEDGKATGYGIGWFIRKDKEGHRLLLHTGASIGGTSVLLIDPNCGVVLALASNCTENPFDKKTLDALVENFFDFSRQK